MIRPSSPCHLFSPPHDCRHSKGATGRICSQANAGSTTGIALRSGAIVVRVHNRCPAFLRFLFLLHTFYLLRQSTTRSMDDEPPYVVVVVIIVFLLQFLSVFIIGHLSLLGKKSLTATTESIRHSSPKHTGTQCPLVHVTLLSHASMLVHVVSTSHALTSCYLVCCEPRGAGKRGQRPSRPPPVLARAEVCE